MGFFFLNFSQKCPILNSISLNVYFLQNLSQIVIPVCIAIGVTPVSLLYNSLSNIPVSGILFLPVKY